MKLALFYLMFVVACLSLLWQVGGWSDPQPCRIVNGREIVTRHCIPYCPPNPSECG